jgi:hypothetical protein
MTREYLVADYALGKNNSRFSQEGNHLQKYNLLQSCSSICSQLPGVVILAF